MKTPTRTFLVILTFFSVGVSRAQTITTIAGSHAYGFSGNGGPALAAKFDELFGAAVDLAGNVYFSDENNNVVWQLNTAGIVNIYAGTGALGYTGDGGPATQATLYHPLWLSVDKLGNLYIIDQNGYFIRKVDPSGIITTFAGKIYGGGNTGDGGPATQATFMAISGAVPDNLGNVFITDAGLGTVRKVNSAGIITTVAGTNVSGFSGDGGPATAAQLNRPYAVVFDGAGNMYIPDAVNFRVRKVDPSGIITTVAGNGMRGYSGDGGQATSAQLDFPWAVAVDNTGALYIGDPLMYVVRKVDKTGKISTFAGNGTYGYSGDGGPAKDAQLSQVSNVAVDNAGNLYITDGFNYVIRKVVNCPLALVSQQPASEAICAGENINFALVATGSTSYQWQSNAGGGWSDLGNGGAYGGTATNNLAITSAVPGMDKTQYRCAIVNGCGTITTVPASLTVNTPSAPTIAIATPLNTICAGVTTSFTVNTYNGGAAPSYQWELNGTGVGTNSSTFASAGLNDGDVVSCILTSNSTCATIPTATSNAVTMTVNPIVTPAISVAGPGGSICAGSPATFTANATNGGTTPAYQWQVNGISAGTNGATYTGSGLNNGDVVSCMLTSDAVCTTTSTAMSIPVAIVVNPLVTPAISVSGPAGAICAGSPATFTASATDGGATPVYQWLVNGVNAGGNTISFVSPVVKDGDVVSCMLTSDGACTTTPTAMSNTVTMQVMPQVTPAVSIATTAPFVCAGSAANFTASPLNGGTAPAYQWLVNGLPTGATGADYVNGSLINGDVISCVMTSDAICLVMPNAVSNPIIEQVKPAANASLTIAASTTAICSGTKVSFTATPVNGGPTPGYQWQVNGQNQGPDNAAFSTTNLANGDVVNCILTSSLSCSVPAAAQNQVVMTVNPNPTVVMMPDTIIALGQSVILEAGVTGPVTNYQWTPTIDLNNASAAAPVATPENTTTYQVIVNTAAKCMATGKVTVGVFKAIRMPSAFTPNGDGNNDLFRIPPSMSVKISAFAVYDRWGVRVFFTNNSASGWDGTMGGQPQPTGTYVWMIEYDDLLTGRTAQAKGTVILIR